MKKRDEIITDPTLIFEEEKSLDISLRPPSLKDYIGQFKVKEQLEVFISAAKKRNEPLDHVLFSGPPGLGKTTLAHIIAHELQTNITVTSGPVLERAGDLAAILTNLKDKDVLFIDEIHRLNHVVEEILYPAMEDFKLDILVGQGPSAKTIRMELPRFTLVGATTRTGLLTSPLRDRFGVALRLEYYGVKELEQIIKRTSSILNVSIKEKGAIEIARRARGTPRIANRLLKRVRDFAEIKADGFISEEVSKSALTLLDVDHQGLDQMDREILDIIVNKYNGGPVGIETIASAVSEEKDTIEDVYEPYLIQIGYIKRTPRGRVATDNAYKHLGIKKLSSTEQVEIF